MIWTIHFEIYEKEAQYSQSLKPRDVFVEKAVNKDEIPYAKGGARSTYAPSSFLIDLFYANPTDIRTKESFIIAKDAGGNEIGIFDNKMKGTKTEGDRTYDSDIIIYRARELYLERKRWPDLLRFHFGGTIDVYQEVPNLKKKAIDNIIIPLYLAIPLSDMNINPNLKQTQGYENL